MKSSSFVAGAASLCAGVIHASAVGAHGDHKQLALIFVALSVAQIGVGLLLMARDQSWMLWSGFFVNLLAAAGWLLTRVSGLRWIDGLEVRESPQWADSIGALLALVSVAWLIGLLALGGLRDSISTAVRPFVVTAPLIMLVGIAMWSMAGIQHQHGDSETSGSHSSAEHSHNDSTSDDTGTVLLDSSSSADAHSHDSSSSDHDHDPGWPRPYDPAAELDISGVLGVTEEQESRARELIYATQEFLPAWADYDQAVEQGWVSIGDQSTGFEHLVNRALIVDDKFLDPRAPESLVYQVEGSDRTLVSAMFMADLGVSLDDPQLTDFAGPLMQWHVHDNLCFRIDSSGKSVVAGVLNNLGECPEGSSQGGSGVAMVHVWIAPHPCGPFAALEGEGAGVALVDDSLRVDMCSSHHDGDHDEFASVDVKDSGDPRIDLSGMPGVSPEEQRRAEDLVYLTRMVLPIFSEVSAAEAAGFTSIQDGGTGYEHYVNWSYINDEYELNPLYPESLVYRWNQQTQKKELVSAMYMMGDEYTLETVPNIGGSLTQWHIHNNLCFSRDPMVFGSTWVVQVTSENGPCQTGIKLQQNPMIHVWLDPHPCGPFAALEGVAAGQIEDDQTRLCDHSHGS